MNTIDRSSSALDRDAASLRIHAFPKGHELWRIDWFGLVAFPDRMVHRRHPSVLVYLSKVVANDALKNPAVLLQPASTLPAHHQIKRWVSVGTTMLLRIGDLWQDQTLVARPSYEEVTFESIQIDREHVTLIKAGLSLDDGAFMLPLSEHPWHLNNTHSYCVSVDLPDKRCLVVPCMEMARFYFGSSSALLSKLFSPPLTKDQLFEDVKRSRFGHMSLKLAHGIPRASAEDIARMAASRDAWHAATLISTSCLRASTAGQDIYPQAVFPFEGITTLQASGKWLSLGDEPNKTFLAYQLHSCSHLFPFRSLFANYYGRGSAHLGTSGFSAAHHSTESTIRSRAATEATPPRLRERDPSRQLSRATGTVSTRRRFPDLEFKATLNKHPQ